MTVSQEFIIGLAIQVAGGLLAIISILVGLLWRNINAKLDRTERLAMERMRTLGHEDREIRSQIHNVLILLDQQTRSKMGDVAAENERLKWMLEESSKMYQRRNDEG